jgi:hypothetical protein
MTEAGRAVLEDVEAIAVGRAAAILQTLSDDDVKQLSDGLAPLYRLVHEGQMPTFNTDTTGADTHRCADRSTFS